MVEPFSATKYIATTAALTGVGGGGITFSTLTPETSPLVGIVSAVATALGIFGTIFWAGNWFQKIYRLNEHQTELIRSEKTEREAMRAELEGVKDRLARIETRMDDCQSSPDCPRNRGRQQQ